VHAGISGDVSVIQSRNTRNINLFVYLNANASRDLFTHIPGTLHPVLECSLKCERYERLVQWE
jgi:hypothetical protein